MVTPSWPKNRVLTLMCVYYLFTVGGPVVWAGHHVAISNGYWTITRVAPSSVGARGKSAQTRMQGVHWAHTTLRRAKEPASLRRKPGQTRMQGVQSAHPNTDSRNEGWVTAVVGTEATSMLLIFCKVEMALIHLSVVKKLDRKSDFTCVMSW